MVINKETIISAFDDKMTLVQWLKTLEKVLKEGVLKDVSIVRVDEGHVKIRFNFMDGTTQDTNEIVLGTTDLATLETLIKGSESVIVDVNEEGDALEVHIDAEVLQKINRALLLPMTTPTEQKIVGVDTANGQNLLGLGEGLAVKDSVLTSDIIVKEGNVLLNPGTADEGFSYMRCYAQNNRLNLIIEGNFTSNESGSIAFTINNLGDEINSKIYRKDGTNLTENATANDERAIITRVPFAYISKSEGEGIATLNSAQVYSNGRNYFNIKLIGWGSFEPNTSYQISIRFELALL